MQKYLQCVHQLSLAGIGFDPTTEEWREATKDARKAWIDSYPQSMSTAGNTAARSENSLRTFPACLHYI